MNRLLANASVVLIAITLGALPASGGFSFVLEKWEGSPGETVEVTGEDLYTCCPPNTPARLVLRLEIDEDSPANYLTLFDTTADDDGVLRTSFVVPDLPEGTYPLRYCAGHPEEPALHGCLPSQSAFLILAPALLPQWVWWSAALGSLLVGLAVLRLRRAKSKRRV